eukprot:12544278-Alexandrium_andersonii.AAC.1
MCIRDSFNGDHVEGHGVEDAVHPRVPGLHRSMGRAAPVAPRAVGRALGATDVPADGVSGTAQPVRERRAGRVHLLAAQAPGHPAVRVDLVLVVLDELLLVQVGPCSFRPRITGHQLDNLGLRHG